MAVVHALVLPLALLALLCLPCLVAMLICADDFLDRAAFRLAERRESWQRRRLIVRLERALPGRRSKPVEEEPEPDHPAIEEIAADLRRLSRQRLGVAASSSVWHAAVMRAYDERLRMACRCLEVPEHLGELEGIDLEIERVRVEGELIAAGFVLGAARRDGTTA
jgi:hypothetical protein